MIPENKTFTTEEFEIGFLTKKFPHDSEYYMHTHDSYEILCFVSGNAEYVVEGKVYRLCPGCVMIMRSAEAHRITINTSEPYSRYVINFYPEKLIRLGFAKELFYPFTNRNLGEQNVYLPSEFPDILPQQYFQKMLARPDHPIARQSCLADLASLLGAISLAFEKKEQNDSKSADKSIGEEIVDYINENLFGDISLAGISQALHISQSQINRIFKKLVGTSVYNYIITKRLVIAAQRISSGKNAVKVSQECGFRHYSSFYRLYKKQFGIAPTHGNDKIYISYN